MYIKFNKERFNDSIDEIQTACKSNEYKLPSILKNYNLPEEYIFPDDEGEEFKQFLKDFPEFKGIVKFILNKEQEEVVTYDIHKFLSIEAGPGAGKTRVLIEKVNYMVNELGVKPESLLIITFSTKSAEELQERLIEGNLSKSDVQKMQISTIHSLCIKLLEEHGDVGYDIIADDYGEKVNMFIGKHLKDLGFVDEYYIPNSQISYIVDKYNEYSAFKVDTDKLVEYIENEWPIDPGYSNYVHTYMENHDGNFPRKDIDKKGNEAYKKSWYRAKYLQIARSYPKYIDLLEEVHAIDYNQMQIKALELLEDNNDVQYTNVLVDEFQDTDPIQMKIFERLMDNIKSKSGPTSFTVVGDINQRIYGFRGSTKDYFKYLRDNFADDFEFKSLSTNYRSTNQIIDISEDFIKHQRDERSPLQKPEYGRKEENNIYYLLNEDKASEAKNLFEIIKYLKNNGKINHYSDIGILSRSVKGKKFTDLIGLLEEHNSQNPNDKIPYQIRGLRNILKRDEIKSILTLMYHLIQDENPHNHIMDKWTSDWLNLKAYTGANFNQVLFDLSEDTKNILNKLQEDFEQKVIDTEKEVYKDFTGKKSGKWKFSGIFDRDEEILIEIFNRLERPILTDENLIRYGVTDKNDLKFFKELNKLKLKVSSDEVEFYNRPTVSDVYFELLTKITGYFTEDNINAHEEETFNLSSITETISNFEEMRYERDFRGFYWFVYRTIEGHDAYSKQDDGLQIMTVHTSKGLEFPVTILASLSDKVFPMEYKDPNPKSGWINRVGYAFYTPKHCLDYKKDEVNEGDTYEQIMEEDKRIYYEEEERVIYVAMTRAEDTLILSSIVDNCEASRKIALERPDDVEYIKSITKGPDCIQKAIDANLGNNCILIDPNNIEIETISRETKEPEGELVNLSFTALENYQNCPFKYKMSNILNFNKSQRAVIEDGIFIHDALDLINKKIKLNDNEYIGDKEVVVAVESLFKKDNYDLEEKDPERFESKLKRITEDVLYYYNNYGKNLKIIDSEYPFHYKDTHYVLNGKIDLICERDGKLVILDYKNTSLDYVDEELEEKYRQKYKKQLHLYVLALRDQNKEYIGRDIDEVEIYAIKSKDVLTFKVEESIIDDLKEQLNQTALDIKAGDKFDSKKCRDCKYCQYSKICNQQ